MAKRNKQSAADILAFLIIECNMPLPSEVGENLSLESPLYQALVRVWNLKNRRAAESNAFLASCIYNAVGGKTKASDFLPKTVESREEEEAALMGNMLAVNVAFGVAPKVSGKK